MKNRKCIYAVVRGDLMLRSYGIPAQSGFLTPELYGIYRAYHPDELNNEEFNMEIHFAGKKFMVNTIDFELFQTSKEAGKYFADNQIN